VEGFAKGVGIGGDGVVPVAEPERPPRRLPIDRYITNHRPNGAAWNRRLGAHSHLLGSGGVTQEEVV
jgi:hypothetical protein